MVRSKSGTFVLLWVLAGSGIASAQEWPEPNIADIAYAVVDGRELSLDLHLPEGVVNPPLLIWIHGGAWQRRSKVEIYTTDLVDEGFAIASVDFRNSVDAPFPAQIHDIKAAIRFLRAHAARYGYDASRIGIHGRSSG
ncbi:MAG: alpha/beta hydrolase fold domain-containing protein, partial [Gammaproteobacteria bacterium]